MAPQNQDSALKMFLSLSWYETVLLFIANFVAKSSEILLTAGLVVSSANFLTDGGMLQKGTPFAVAWAWTQALAIDGSLGISFYSVFQSLQQRDWIKCALYSILTVLLTLVALFITEGDILSHAMNTSPHEAMEMLGVNVQILSILRAIAVVGFVLMSRLREVPLQTSLMPSKQKDILSQGTSVLHQNGYITVEELGQTMQPRLQKTQASAKSTIQEPESTPIIAQKPEQEVDSQDHINQATSHTGTIMLTDQEKLLQAYRSLQEEGVKISGRTLAQRAHIRRSTCLEWLRAYQEKSQLEDTTISNIEEAYSA